MPAQSSILAAVLLLCFPAVGMAAEWSDTAHWRIGNTFRQPFNPLEIRKGNFALTVSGEPGSLYPRSGARQAYVVGSHAQGIGQPQGVGATAGFDWNTMSDIRASSGKRMLVPGPTLMGKTPGFLGTSVLLSEESAAPGGVYPSISALRGRAGYSLHPASWGIPTWHGRYANLIAAQGRDEVGIPTGAETGVDRQVMRDLGEALRSPGNMFRIGLDHPSWHKQVGHTAAAPGGRAVARPYADGARQSAFLKSFAVRKSIRTAP